jgi:hypothetical protein
MRLISFCTDMLEGRFHRETFSGKVKSTFFILNLSSRAGALDTAQARYPIHFTAKGGSLPAFGFRGLGG